jgi:hypothetical protein
MEARAGVHCQGLGDLYIRKLSNLTFRPRSLKRYVEIFLDFWKCDPKALHQSPLLPITVTRDFTTTTLTVAKKVLHPKTPSLCR